MRINRSCRLRLFRLCLKRRNPRFRIPAQNATRVLRDEALSATSSVVSLSNAQVTSSRLGGTGMAACAASNAVMRDEAQRLVVDGAALITGKMTAKVSVAGRIVHIDNRYLAAWVREHCGEFHADRDSPARRRVFS